MHIFLGLRKNYKKLRIDSQLQLRSLTIRMMVNENEWEWLRMDEDVRREYSSGFFFSSLRIFHRNSNLFFMESEAVECIVCLNRVKPQSPIWNCPTCCKFFHLACIRQWSLSSASLSKPSQGQISFPCPACNVDSKEISSGSGIPYVCFCGNWIDMERVGDRQRDKGRHTRLIKQTFQTISLFYRWSKGSSYSVQIPPSLI